MGHVWRLDPAHPPPQDPRFPGCAAMAVLLALSGAAGPLAGLWCLRRARAADTWRREADRECAFWKARATAPAAKTPGAVPGAGSENWYG